MDRIKWMWDVVGRGVIAYLTACAGYAIGAWKFGAEAGDLVRPLSYAGALLVAMVVVALVGAHIQAATREIGRMTSDG